MSLIGVERARSGPTALRPGGGRNGKGRKNVSESTFDSRHTGRSQSRLVSMTNGHHHDVLERLGPEHRALRQLIPDVYRGFAAMSEAALGEGALDAKTKELMAMAIGIVHGCDGCIASHAKAAVRAGATTQEAAEAIGVSILMHGGPATIYGARAFTAFNEFAQDAVPASGA